MANLVELRVKDFRAFRSATLALKSSGLTLVAGPNNFGKSAFLSAFDVLATEETPASVGHAAGGDARIWARWELTEAESQRILGNTSETDRLKKEGAAKWLEWEFGAFNGSLQPIAATVSWPDTGQLEFIRMSGGAVGGVAAVAPTVLATWDQNSRNQSGAPAGTLAVNSFGGSEAADCAVDILRQWRAGYFHFRPLRESQGRQSQLGNAIPTLNSSGANLPNVLLYLRNGQPAIWDQIVALIQQLVPGVGRLMTPLDNNQFSIVFQDEVVTTHQHNLKDLGTGVEQILMALVVGLSQTATTVVLEEPEMGLHPGAQRALLALLQDWSKERLVIASTHSATMLDWTSPTTTVLAVSRTGTESRINRVTTERTDVLRDLGVRLSDVLSADCILIVEGTTDKDIFDAWFPYLIRNPRVVVVDGGGGYNAHHADLFVKWLATVDQLGTRRVLYARDSDELSTAFRAKLESSPHVYLMPCREIENLLLDPEAIASVINLELTKRQKPLVSPLDIASDIREAADNLKQTVELKRTMADLAEPIRLVDHKLRNNLARANAGVAELTAAIIRRIPNSSELEEKISAHWQANATAIATVWDGQWKLLAPGADVLKAVFVKHLDRGYSKSADGLAIANAMKSPPTEISGALGNFVSGSAPA